MKNNENKLLLLLFKELYLSRIKMKRIAITIFGAISLLSNQSNALESGKSQYSHGAENFMSGAVPPPGIHGLLYATHYRADRLNDHNGDQVNIPNFDVQATAIVPRFVWVSETQILGGNFVLGTLIPLVHLNSTAANAKVSDSGLGDVIINTALGFHHSPQRHSAITIDTYLPTGDYNKNKIANIGTNRTAFEPAYAVTYIGDKIAADARIGYIFNGKNNDTGYTRGDEFHIDYALGLNHKAFTYGIGGYYQRQMQNDRLSGVSLENSKVEDFSIGPTLKYQNKNWFITAKYEKEIIAKNRTEGDSFWIKTVLPF